MKQQKKRPRLPKPCKDCEKYFTPATKFSRICDDCFKESKNRRTKSLIKPKNTLFSQIQAREREKKQKMNRYALIDENDKIIEKFRSKNLANIELMKLQPFFYTKLRITELEGGEKLK